MLLLVAALILGFIVGRLNLLPQNFQTYSGKLGTIALLVLLFAMGVTIGANPDVISNVGTLGFQALLLAAAAIAGSVACVWGAVQIFHNKKTPYNESKERAL